MSFRLKTILGIALIEAILLVALVWSGLSYLRSSNEAALDARAATSARMFATTIKNAAIATDLGSLKSFFDEVATNPDLVYARLVDRHGRVLASRGRPLVDHVVSASADIIEGGILFGRVEIGYDSGLIDGTIAKARTVFVSIAAVEMVLVAIFSALLGTHLTRQLSALEVGAGRLAAGTAAFSVPVCGNDELARTAKAFNAMAAMVAESQTRLQAEVERFDIAVRGAEDGLWDWNLATGRVYYSPRWREMVGGPVGESIDDWLGRIPPEDRDAVERDLSAHLEGRAPHFRSTHRLQRADSSDLWVLVRGTRVTDRTGKVVRMVGFQTDVTLQKRAEAEIRAASQAKSEFLATMSHEIRTPLNGIIGTLQLLKEAPPSAQSDLLAVALRSSDRLLGLLGDILDLSTIEAGKLDLVHDLVDVAALAHDLSGLFGATALTKGINFIVTCRPDAPLLVGDPRRLFQIMANLAGNAVKFTECGSVSVTIDVRDDGEVRLTVTDTGIGIGIPEEVQSRLFQPFSRGQGNASARYGGTGLGLAIVRRLTEAMGGTVTLASLSGQGTTATVLLPMAIAVPSGGCAEVGLLPAVPAECRASGGVLVAEDDEVNRYVLLGMLDRLGITADIAVDGAEAVRMATAHRYDLILMDCRMPEMDGPEATRAIRKAENSAPAVPIIAITANVMSISREECLAAGMNAFLSKPIRLPILEQEIRQWVEAPAAESIG